MSLTLKLRLTASEWEEAVDSTGTPYFYHTRTHETTWQRPQSSDLRRRTIQVSQDDALDQLRGVVAECFQLPPNTGFSMQWHDEDGDLIAVCTEGDAREALNCNPPLRLDVTLHCRGGEPVHKDEPVTEPQREAAKIAAADFESPEARPAETAGGCGTGVIAMSRQEARSQKKAGNRAAKKERRAMRLAEEALAQDVDEQLRIEQTFQQAAIAAQAAAGKGSATPAEWHWLVDTLVAMGFSGPIADDAVREARGDFDVALAAALTRTEQAKRTEAANTNKTMQPPPAYAAPVALQLPKAAMVSDSNWDSSWDAVLVELEEMGFTDKPGNRQVVAQHKGDLKAVVAALIKAERSHR